ESIEIATMKMRLPLGRSHDNRESFPPEYVDYAMQSIFSCRNALHQRNGLSLTA
ncbi:unnamed protein product, partial [Dovyalis caffra]